MTYHDSFWIAAAAAAPIIALASIVSARRPEGKPLEIPEADRRRANTRAGWLGLVHFVNLSLQLVVLSCAFLSLAWQRDALPPALLMWVEPIGLVLLITGSYIAISLWTIDDRESNGGAGAAARPGGQTDTAARSQTEQQ